MAGANAQDDNLHDQEQQQNLDQQQQNQPAPNDADDLAAQLGLAPAKPGDLDHARLLEAIAEVEAEGGQPEAQPEQGQDAAPAAESSTPASQPQAKPQVMIPEPRFREVVSKLKDLEREHIRVTAQNEVLTKLVTTGEITPQQAAAIQEGRADMPEQRVDPFASEYDALDAAEIAAAEKFNNAEISYVDLKKEELRIARERRTLEDRRDAARRQQDAESSIGQATDQVAQTFDVINHINQSQLDACAPLGRVNTDAELAKRGESFNPANPAHILLFRWHTAAVADMQFNGGRGVEQYHARASGRQQQQNPQGAAPASQQTNQRKPTTLRDKLNVAGNMPPDLNQQRQTTQNVNPESLEAKVLGATTEEMAALLKSGALDHLMKGVST